MAFCIEASIERVVGAREDQHVRRHEAVHCEALAALLEPRDETEQGAPVGGLGGRAVGRGEAALLAQMKALFADVVIGADGFAVQRVDVIGVEEILVDEFPVAIEVDIEAIGD